MATYVDSYIYLGVSKTNEAAYNQLVSNGFRRALTENNTIVIPMLEKIGMGTLIGAGNEFELGARPDYWTPPQFSIAEFLNFEMAALLLADALGGTITDTVVTAGQSYEHTVAMQLDPILQLPSRTVTLGTDNNQYFLAGCCVNQFGITIESGGQPKFSADMIGSGLHILGTAGLAALALTDYNYAHPAATTVKWTGATTDYGTNFNFTASGRLRDLSFQLSNNLKVGGKERQPGDPFQTSGVPSSGAYQNRLRRGRRSASISLTALMDENRREYNAMKNNTILTGLTITSQGQFIGTSTDLYTFELSIPRCRISNINPGNQDNDLVVTFDVMPLKDTVTGGIITLRVRNSNATSMMSLT